MPAALDDDFLALEKQYWEAIRDRDATAAALLSDERCIVIGPLGIGEIDQNALAGLVANAPYELKKFRFGDAVHVRRLAEDVALIAYKMSEDRVVDGKATTLEAFDLSIWVRRDGHWVCAAHTETLAQK